MTAKRKKARRRRARSWPGKLIELQASVEDDLLSLAEEEGSRRVTLEPSTQAEDLVARGYRSGRLVQVQRSGFQTRINRILRRVMVEGKKGTGEG
jgi:hypothetical protein